MGALDEDPQFELVEDNEAVDAAKTADETDEDEDE